MDVEKKRGIIILLVFVFVILNLSNVRAAIGVYPASYERDFKPNFEEEFVFNFFQDGDSPLGISTAGDLTEYLKLIKTDESKGQVSVTARLKLPSNIETPGMHRIYVVAGQGASREQGFGMVGAIRGVIKMKVPYPGKYAEISFSAGNANAGQPILFKLKISSMGVEMISTNSYIEIYDSAGSKLNTLLLDAVDIPSTESVDLSAQLDTKGMAPGDYKAVVTVNYDGNVIKQETIFRLGEMRVGIVNSTKIFKRDKINRIEVDVESFWNDPIDNVFVTGRIVGYDLNFITPSIILKGFEKSRVTGFFDTSDIKEDKFRADLFVHYGNKTSSKVFELELEKKSFMMYYIIGAAALLVIIVIVILVILVIKYRTSSRKNAKKNK